MTKSTDIPTKPIKLNWDVDPFEDQDELIEKLKKEIEEWKQKYYDLLGLYKQEGEYHH